MTSISPISVSVPTSIPEQDRGWLKAVLRALLRSLARTASDRGSDMSARRCAEIELERLRSGLGTLPHSF
jgi:hypothetical protein